METIKTNDNILSIADDYNTIFVDMYGVLFDGMSFYDQALATLEILKRNGKKIVILSNSTQTSHEAKAGYEKKGLFQGIHYDEYITSGEFLHNFINNRRDEFYDIMGGKSETVKCIFLGNGTVFEGTHIRRVDIYEADFLYIGIPRASYGAVRIDDIYDSGGNKVGVENILEYDWNTLQDSKGRKGLAEFASQLDKCLRLEKTLLVSNPDIFSNWVCDKTSDRGAIMTQGAIAAYYEKLGGKVIYFGKPYKGIFKYAELSSDAKGPILMVGDTPWTDISGAENYGIDSALVTDTGVSHEFIKGMIPSLSLGEKYKILFEQIAPKMTNLKHNAWPKYFLSRFAYAG